MRPTAPACAAALLPLLALPAAAQAVHTVDAADPGADFATIQAAVDAALPGDVVLVRPGTYAPFDVVGKGVSVVGDGEPAPLVLGPKAASTSRVTGVPAGQLASIAGLRFRPQEGVAGGTTGELLDVSGNAGTVWLEELRLERIVVPLFGSLDQQQGLRIADCARVVVVESLVQGQHGSTQPTFGQEYGSRAALVSSSEAYFLDCVLEGGAMSVLSTVGREGLRVEGALVVLRDSTVRGGMGGPGQSFPPPTFLPGQGGPGAVLADAAALWTIGSELLGGPGGGFQDGSGGPPGPVGVPLVQAPGTAHTDHAARPVDLAAPVVVREDTDVALVVSTDPGSVVLLLAAFAANPLFLPAFPDVTGVGLAPVILPLPAADATGHTQLVLGVPLLPAALDAFPWLLQAAALTPTSGLELSEPSRVVGLQSRF